MDEKVIPVRWLNPRDFRGRETVIRSAGPAPQDNGWEVVRIPIPDDEILCDLCNSPIVDFPCPVVHGYALCGPSGENCREKVYHIHSGDTEYFETYAFHAGMEPPEPGVNFGGRKR